MGTFGSHHCPTAQHYAMSCWSDVFDDLLPWNESQRALVLSAHRHVVRDLVLLVDGQKFESHCGQIQPTLLSHHTPVSALIACTCLPSLYARVKLSHSGLLAEMQRWAKNVQRNTR